MLLMWVGLILAGVVLLIVFAADELDSGEVTRPEVLLPLIVIAGVVALIATLAVSAALYGLFNLSDKGQALGLPAGSVQAVIALSLILIFAVVALYASSSSGTERFTSSGLTPAEFQDIPPSQIVSSTAKEENGSVTFEVVRSIEDPAKKDINTQLLTTVSTLVIAVAGFYFGSKSVQEGNRTAIEAAGPNRSLTITPASPHMMRAVEPLPVKLQSVPLGAQLNWFLHDDPSGHLMRQEDGGFVYEPSQEMGGSGKSANLIFEQVDDPGTSASLIVNFPEAEGKEVEPESVEPEEPDPDGETDEEAEHRRVLERQRTLKERPAVKPRPASQPGDGPDSVRSTPPASPT